MRDKEILEASGVTQRFAAQTLGIDPATVSKRFKREDGIAFSRTEWLTILEQVQKVQPPLSRALREILVQNGRLEEGSIAMIRAEIRSSKKVERSVVDGMDVMDLCRQLSSAGVETLSLEDLIYLSSAWRTIGGEFDAQLAVSLLQHRKKKAE